MKPNDNANLAERNAARLYAEFENPAPLPPEADVDGAMRELDHRLASLTPLANAPQTPRWPRWLLRPALALAAVLLLAVGIFSGRELSQQPAGDFQREVVRGNAPVAATLQVTPDSEGVTLSWQLTAGADGAVIVLLDRQMKTVQRVVTSGVTGYRLTADELAGAAYVRLELMQAGDVVESLTPAPLR